MLHNYLIQVKFKGVKNLLCAHGRAGQTQLPYWRRISQSEIRKIAVAKKEAAKARAGKNSLPAGRPPQNHFLSVRSFNKGGLLARPSGKVLIKIRSLNFRQKSSDFVQQIPPY